MLKQISSLKDSVFFRLRGFAAAAKTKLADDSGVGVIEIILILLVLVGLVIIFKNQINSLARNIFSNINSQAGGI